MGGKVEAILGQVQRAGKYEGVEQGLYSGRRSSPGNGTESNAEHPLNIRSASVFWGFPNQLSSDSWVVGFEEADHAALLIARRPMGADQRSSARARRSCGRQCSRQPAVR